MPKAELRARRGIRDREPCLPSRIPRSRCQQDTSP